MTNGHRAVMCRRLGEPARHVRVWMIAELHRRLRVADSHDRPVRGLAFAGDELQPTIAGLRHIQGRDRPRLHLRLDGYARALLPVIKPHPAQNRLSFGNRDMERSVMTQQDRLVDIIHDDDFREAAADAKDVADFHRDGRLEVPFAGARDTACGEQRMANDEAALQLLVIAPRRTVVVVGQGI